MTITDAIHQALLNIPEKAWTPAYDAGGTERPGAWLAEITDMPDLSSWPTGMRLVVREERPHPGAQLRFTDVDGNRLTRFATDTKGGRLATLELRHRRRARCEDRIRNARNTGLPKPAPAPHCPEPDLAGDRLPRAGPPGLDADARSDRRPLPLGTQEAPPAAVFRRRPTHHHGPPPLAPYDRPMALDRRHHPGNRPAPGPAEPRLTSHFDRPDNPRPPESGTRRPPRRDNRAISLPRTRKDRTTQTQSPRQRTDEDS
ncbi:hypothetical protein GCM10011583_71380 [Streptomyces camponoticapitis]|uniref:Transposase n=1 Tax=Streptomyces camponoticapitis TaxID=1616125 RepID=A0ABQ2EWG8_9ACTN|nr:hypothetical protein GCM10011583_71380 [Streptomyces camponoticapitis]